MKRILTWLSFVVVIGLVAGCSWESPGTEETWNSENDWANFSGVYRNPGGGAMVLKYQLTPGTAASTNVVTGEIVEMGVGAAASEYGGTFDSRPIAPGTAAISAGGYMFNDNGNGTLIGSAGRLGTIDYQTGVWSIDLNAGIVSQGTALIGSYSYVIGGTGGQIEPGSSGTVIYRMTVLQQGNLITFTDSDAMVYTGRISTVTSTTGEQEGEARGMVVGMFEVRGTSKNGKAILISGTLTAVRQKVNEEFQTSGEDSLNVTFSFFYLTYRTIEGVWIEYDSGGNVAQTGDVVGGTQDVIFQQLSRDLGEDGGGGSN